MAVLITLLALAVLLLGVLVVGLLRTHAEILRALHDLGVNLDPAQDGGSDHRQHQHQHSDRLQIRPGVPQPRTTETEAFDLAGIDHVGEAISIAVAGTDRLTLLAFLSSSCLTCRDFWQEFGSAHLDVPGDARPIIVTKGLDAESESAVRKLAPKHVITVMSSEGWADYRVPVAPYFIMIDGSSDRIIGEGAATNWVQVRNLMEQSMADAGLAAERGERLTSGSAATSARMNGEARTRRIDDELRAAGILPGDPRLHHLPVDEVDES